MQGLIIFLAVLDVIVCAALVYLVITQQGNDQGLGSIAGGAETFLGQGKGNTLEDKLKRATSWMAIAFAVLSILLYLLTGRA